MLSALNQVVNGWFKDGGYLEHTDGIVGFEESIISVLPYRAYDKKSQLFVNESSFGFMMEVTPFPSTDTEVVDALSGVFADNVPEYASVQVICYASPRVGHHFRQWSAIRADKSEVYQSLADRRTQYFKGSGKTSPLKNTNHLMRDFRVFVVGSMPAESNSPEESLKSMRENFRECLEGLGVGVHVMNALDFLSVMDEVMHPSEDEERSDLRWRSLDPLNNQLVREEYSYRVEPHRLVVADTYDVRALTVNKLPETWASWQNHMLLGAPTTDNRVPCPFLVSMTFTTSTHEKDSSKASLKSLRRVKQVSSGVARLVPVIQQEADEWQYVAMKVGEGHSLVQCYYQVLIFSKLGEGDRAEQAVRTIYKRNGWNLTRDRYMQFQSFLAALPFTMSEGLAGELKMLGRTRTLLDWTCANLAPLLAEYKSGSAPVMLLIGRRGQPFTWDPYGNQEGNYNVAVIGKSGAGKSVFMQELIMGIASTGGQVMVIDDGYSFKHSCLLQEGDFVAFSNENITCLNPFSIIDTEAFEIDAEYRADVISMICGVVRQMCRSQEQKTSDLENAAIEKAVNSAFQAKGVEADINLVGEFLLKSTDDRIRDLGEMLGPYMKGGIYERYWNGRCTLTVGAHLTVFELSNIKAHKELQGLVMMMLMFLANNVMYHGDRTRRKALVIDEAWDLLHGPASKLFIEAVARRARKYNGSLITGTQSANDYYKNEAALAAYENTDWICFLAQKNDSITHLKKQGRITVDDGMEREMQSLRMLEGKYSEIMIYGPQGYVVGRLMLDPFSVKLYSSKATDFNRITHLMKEEGLSLPDAIEKHVGAQNG